MVDYFGNVSKALIIIFFGVVFLWDCFAIFFNKEAATFSVVLFEASKEWPIIPFMFGLVCGHLFWQVR